MILGILETGQNLDLDPRANWHWAIQGMSRSGKSVFCYSVLANLAKDPCAVVAGIDPSGILLAPFRTHPHPELRHLGTKDMTGAAGVISNLCDLMDERIAGLVDNDLDKIERYTPDTPLVVVVLEEYPGTLSTAEGEDQASGRKTHERVAPVIKAGVRRLIQEGAKAGIRVILIAQRMDASIVGGAERSNLGNRITFRVDNSDAIKMLHPELPPDLVTRVLEARPGVGVIESPSLPAVMFKGDVAEYSAYSRFVKAHGHE